MNPDTANETCYHCGDPVPPELNLQVVIEDEPRPVCCRGCQAVANLLIGSDMSAFYTTRTGFAPRPEDVDPRVVDWFRDDDWVSRFRRQSDHGDEIALLVSGMSCAACTWVVERFLGEIPHVRDVDVNLTLSRVVITLDPDSEPAPAVEELLKLGYGVRPWRNDERLEQMRSESKRDMRRLGVAGLGMMQVGMFAIALHAGDLQGIDSDLQTLMRGFSAPLTLFVLFYSGRTFFQTAWSHLKHGALVMDSSVSLALLLATVASLWATVTRTGDTYYDSVTMFVFFLLLARFIEQRLRDADLIAIIKLEDLLPEFVNALSNGSWSRTPRDRIVPGDVLRVAAGEAIAFDGEVLNGQSAVEESVFTGESLPRSVAAGDQVFAGTVNREASIEFRATSGYRDSRLAALADDVERARGEKPPYLKLIDQLAARFVGFILFAAAVTFGLWLWRDSSQAVWASLAVLVVACPCALSLATPAAMASATAWLRRHGVNVRGEFGLLAAADATRVLVDKTGTLTETELAIGEVILPDADNCDAHSNHVLTLAAGMQQFSSHPAAKAFQSIEPRSGIGNVEIVAGSGLEGVYANGGVEQRLRLGSEQFCREWCAELPPPPDNERYWIALVYDNRWLGWIGLRESLRPGAQLTIERLQALGLDIEVLSGDKPERVAPIAQALAIDFQGGMQPADKLERLKALQSSGEIVVAVGDGLNDAPLLGAADASIAVAGATALARAQADFAITDNDLDRVATIVQAARRARGIMKQNLMWAAGYNLLGIPFAALGYIPPWVAALGMSLSSLVVVLNALRLRRMEA